VPDVALLLLLQQVRIKGLWCHMCWHSGGNTAAVALRGQGLVTAAWTREFAALLMKGCLQGHGDATAAETLLMQKCCRAGLQLLLLLLLLLLWK
jgi:hypothetical protein